MNQQIPPVILPEKVTTSKLSHTTLRESPTQYYTFPKYDSKDLVFQISEIKLTQDGIPKKGTFYETDIKRSYIKPQLDSTQPNCLPVHHMLNDLTTWFQSNYKTILGKDETYEIKPLVIDSNNGQSYCTLKFNLKYPENNIITKCFMTTKCLETDITTRIPIENPNINQLYYNTRRGSIFQALVHVNKIWFNKHTQENGNKLAGIKLTLLQLETIKYIQPKVPLQMLFTDYKMIDSKTNDDSEKIEI